MAWHRQDVRQFVPGQKLVASERLFGHRGRKGRNGKALPKRSNAKWEPTSNAAAASVPTMVRQDTPWPGTGKMSGNLFQDRNWLLPKGYLATEGEKEEMAKPYPKEGDKMGEQDPKEEKCGWGPNCSLCKAQKKEANPPHHPNMIKKMKTFLEMENKMGPIIPALANKYRLPLPETNPNIAKGNATKKRKTVTPKRRFRPATQKATVTHLPLPQAPPKPPAIQLQHQCPQW